MFEIKKKLLAYGVCMAMLTGLSGCSHVEDSIDLFRETVQNRLSSQEEEETITRPEKEIPQEQAAYYYGYNSLDEEAQKVYRQLAAGIENFQEEIPVDSTSQEQLEKVMRVLIADHPEYFWTDGTSSYTYQELPGGRAWNMEVRPEYQVGSQEAQTLKAQIEAKADQWIQGAPEGDAYEKIKYVYETLIDQVEYQENSPQNQNIRSVFLEGKTVCMGYSKAAQYLLNRMGIFCTLVIGTVTGEKPSSHAWNLVRIGEQYYYMDVTWGNPGYLNPVEDDAYISYSYLCCNEETLAPTHVPDDTIPLPSCQDDSYNYYKNKGRWYDSFDWNQIYQVIQEDLVQGAEMTELRFAGQESYDLAAEALVGGSLIQEAVQNSTALMPGQSFSWQTYYGGSDYLIIIMWQ
ncbi:MAG TPA: S-layer protein [Candidatus Blautia merdigallinarum]|uniref:S-layer protein n=1 Tax=Candidatus Blautia merdigallinarum TaxID=2838495 RepID=A0A9D2SLS6_9FIRM|nr:S-layer protein [Candidatus Blautia merdigallinarum]